MNSVGQNLDLWSGAVSCAIFRKAGTKLQDLLMKEKPQTPVSDGCVLVTGGCDLQSDLVIHCVVPKWDKGQGSSEKVMDGYTVVGWGAVLFPHIGFPLKEQVQTDVIQTNLLNCFTYRGTAILVVTISKEAQKRSLGGSVFLNLTKQ